MILPSTVSNSCQVKALRVPGGVFDTDGTRMGALRGATARATHAPSTHTPAISSVSHHHYSFDQYLVISARRENTFERDGGRSRPERSKVFEPRRGARRRRRRLAPCRQFISVPSVSKNTVRAAASDAMSTSENPSCPSCPLRGSISAVPLRSPRLRGEDTLVAATLYWVENAPEMGRRNRLQSKISNPHL